MNVGWQEENFEFSSSFDRKHRIKMENKPDYKRTTVSLIEGLQSRL